MARAPCGGAPSDFEEGLSAMMETSYAYVESPLGLIEIGGIADAITSVAYVHAPRDSPPPGRLLREARQQLSDYFAGQRRIFDLRFRLDGTTFQLRVWTQMLGVPFGQTVAYQTLARQVGLNHGARAVGGAAGQNPLPIIVPCHRVVGSGGGLVGYTGGVWRKEWLLRHEAAILV